MRMKFINKESFETLQDAMDEVQRLVREGWWVMDADWEGWIMVKV